MKKKYVYIVNTIYSIIMNIFTLKKNLKIKKMQDKSYFGH